MLYPNCPAGRLFGAAPLLYLTMKAIENTTPEELLKEAATQLINEQKHAAVAQIKDTLKRVAQLSNDIKTMQQAVEKKQKELDGANGRLEKLRAGDWSVLQDQKAEKSDKPQEATDAV